MNIQMHRTVAALAIFLLIGLQPAVAQQIEPDDDFNKGGRTAMQFLKIGIGARPVAMGEAGIAAVRDVNAAFWNPANIAGVERMEASFTYTKWYADLDYMAGAFGIRWNRVGVFALSIASLDYGDLEEAVLGGGPGDARTGQTFSGSNFLGGLSFARQFTDRLWIGIGAKYVHESLFEYSVGTFAFDVGSSYDLGYQGIRVSMAAQNLAGAVSWLGENSDRSDSGYDLPLLFRIGVATNLAGATNAFLSTGPEHRLVLAAEAINSNDYGERFNLGFEYSFNELLALRGGYRFNADHTGFTVGGGLAPSVSGVQLRLDYAFVAHEYLNAPHRFSMSVAF